MVMDHDKDVSIDMNVNRDYGMRHVVRDTAMKGKSKRRSGKGIESKSTCKQNKLKGGERGTGYDPVDAKNHSIEVQESKKATRTTSK